MDIKQKHYFVFWAITHPAMNYAYLTKTEVEEGFQYGDQFIGHWVIFEDIEECQKLLEIVRQECAA